MLLTEFTHLICRGITYIMDRILMFLFKERHLERQDGEKFIHIALDILNTVFFPCPNFRRNIVKHLRSRGVGIHIMDILGNA